MSKKRSNRTKNKRMLVIIILTLCAIVFLVSSINIFRINTTHIAKQEGVKLDQQIEINDCVSSEDIFKCVSKIIVENRKKELVISGKICEDSNTKLKEICYLHVAVLFGNEDFCNELSTSDENKNCRAFAGSNIILCEEIEDSTVKESCYKNYEEVIEERNAVINIG